MNERQVANMALELADKLMDNLTMEYDCDKYMEQAAIMLRSQEKYINQLHKLLNVNKIGAGRNLTTGEIIPFEVEE